MTNHIPVLTDWNAVPISPVLMDVRLRRTLKMMDRQLVSKQDR